MVNGRDELGPNLVPDCPTSVRDGDFYGWPHSYYGQHVDERVHPQRPDMVAKAIPPDYSLSGHVAALGLTFHTSANPPPACHGGAFTGEHGSRDRRRLNGDKVAFVPFANGRPSGMAQGFLTGFLSPTARRTTVRSASRWTERARCPSPTMQATWSGASHGGPEPLAAGRTPVAEDGN